MGMVAYLMDVSTLHVGTFIILLMSQMTLQAYMKNLQPRPFEQDYYVRTWLLRVDMNPPKPEDSFPDRFVSFLHYSSTKTNLTVTSYLVNFANWMKYVEKCQKIAGY